LHILDILAVEYTVSEMTIHELWPLAAMSGQHIDIVARNVVAAVTLEVDDPKYISG
jgi:hypothetical protein